jgi:hypothetical protein
MPARRRAGALGPGRDPAGAVTLLQLEETTDEIS